jgi:hypothetical protein
MMLDRAGVIFDHPEAQEALPRDGKATKTCRIIAVSRWLIYWVPV